MTELNQLTKLLSGIPSGVLVIVLILAGFGLAAYAIHAVLSVTKGDK